MYIYTYICIFIRPPLHSFHVRARSMTFKCRSYPEPAANHLSCPILVAR